MTRTTLRPGREPLRAVIRSEGLTRTELASILGRLGYCLWSSTALLYTASRFGLTVAGYAVLLLTVTAAISAAPLSALFEAPARPFLISGLIGLNACSGLLVLAAGRRHALVALGGVVLAGFSAPPTAAVMRAIWRSSPRVPELARLLAMESLITQVCLVASPALVAFLVAGPLPVLAPVTASCCVCCGSGLMWAWSRRHLGRSAEIGPAGSAAGRLPMAGRLLGIFGLICASAMVSGFFNISVTSRFAGRPELPDGAGTLISAAAIGSITGGVLFTRFWRSSASRWGYPALMSAWALTFWLLAVAGHGYLVLAVALVSGLPVTGIGAEEFRVLGQSAGSRPARMFGLANTAIRAGVGLGAAAGAQLLRDLPRAGLLLPAVAATAVLIISVILWPALASSSTT